MKSAGRWALVAILLIGLNSLTHAQSRRADGPQAGGATVSGTIVDERNNPIEYATVMLLRARDSSRIAGSATDASGRFVIKNSRPGEYLVRVSVIGFLPRTLEKLEIEPGRQKLDLGTIVLESTAIPIDEVRVTGEAPAIEYHLDKKVINVQRQTTAISGTAVDVLENAPSVSVDIEGNVALRGSGNFTVLIDGRPSILEGSEALQQIPAGTIESIEIITNPSAKFDPGSTAGIINVILTRQRQSGYSSLINVSGGTQNNRGASVLLTRKLNGVTLLLGGNWDERNHPGDERRESRTTVDDVTSNVATVGRNDRGREGWGLRTEIDWQPDNRNSAKIGGRFGGRSFAGESTLDHSEWSSLDPSVSTYNSSNSREHSGRRIALYSTLRHDFVPRKSYLTLNGHYSRRDGDEETQNELYGEDGRIVEGARSTEDGPGTRAVIELDYSNQFTEHSRLETGVHTRFGQAEDGTSSSVYDTVLAAYVEQSEYRNSTDYQRDIHALYATYGNRLGGIDCQLGMRGEYTYRKITLVESDQASSIDRWDYFPTAHLSRDMGGGRSLAASYARRINRPRGWFLEPFLTWEDAYNVREGNPGLKPEYVDSYEAGIQSPLLGANVSLEGYYRLTHNRIERIQSVYSENVTLRSIRNVGQDHSLGGEYRVSVSPWKAWEANLSGNLYDYRVEGELDGRSFDRHSFTWDARLNNRIQLRPTLRLQLDAMYNGPRVDAQGEREEFWVMNAGVAKQFWDNQLTATLQVRDLLASAVHEFASSGPGFSDYSRFERDSPSIQLNLAFNFNRFKQERDRSGNGEMGEDDF